MPLKFYIAAPFFNPAQNALVESIELAFCDAQIPFFSPRLSTGNKKPGPITPEMAHDIFQSNMLGLHECDAMLAVLDWKLPEGELICRGRLKPVGPMEEKAAPYASSYFAPIGTPLHLPDTGTVYEMGYMHAKGRPIVGYTERDRSEALNLMLTTGLRGVISGKSELLDFLGLDRDDMPQTMRKPGVWWANLKPWEGRNS